MMTTIVTIESRPIDRPLREPPEEETDSVETGRLGMNDVETIGSIDTKSIPCVHTICTSKITEKVDY